jgi:hypothetical protein
MLDNKDLLIIDYLLARTPTQQSALDAARICIAPTQKSGYRCWEKIMLHSRHSTIMGAHVLQPLAVKGGSRRWEKKVLPE